MQASETSLVDSSIVYGDPSADVGDEVRWRAHVLQSRCTTNSMV